MPTCQCCSLSPDLFLPSKFEAPASGSTTVEDVENMMSPQEALLALDQVTLLDSHNHVHIISDSGGAPSVYQSERGRAGKFISVTCAIKTQDWDGCLDFCQHSKDRIAALGIHPWYLDDLTEDWLDRLEERLQEHSGIMVGEIGLCKVARFVRFHPEGKEAAFALQRNVFTKQLQLSIKYTRSVSVHCVQQQSILFDILRENITSDNHPPSIALHSYSGTAHQVTQLLKWETSLGLDRPLLYFGISHAVNYAMCSSAKSRRQNVAAIKAIPANRLMAESDLQDHAEGGTAAAVAYIASCRCEPILEVARQLLRNSQKFLEAHHQAVSD